MKRTERFTLASLVMGLVLSALGIRAQAQEREYSLSFGAAAARVAFFLQRFAE